MPETLPAFVKTRAERSFRNLLKQIEGLTAEEARRGSLPNWPGHRWGIGQNGSIAGIVFHVAAWKQLTLPLLSGGKARTQEADDFDAAPAPDDWPGLVAWLQQVGEAWNAALSRLPEADFDTPTEWEGMTLTLARIITEMYEHDIQHAAQIEFLRWRWHAEARRP
jgi:hypothetical protein